MTSSDLQLYFCDLCSQSIAQSEIDSRRAVEVRGKWVCASCCAAAPTSPVAPSLGATPSTSTLPSVNGGRPRAPMSGSSFAALALAVLAVVGVVVVAVQARREVTAMRREVARVDPAQAERVRALQQRLDGLHASLQRWFDDSWERARATLPPPPEPNASVRALDEVAAAVAEARVEVEELASRHDETLRELRERLVSLERHWAIAAANGNASAVEPAAAELAELAPERKAVLDRLRSAEPVQRVEALFELMARKDSADIPYVAAMLRDPDPFVRVTAARHLELVGAKVAIGGLLDALQDADATVRLAADSALRGITGQRFRFDPFGTPEGRAAGIDEWRGWWSGAWKSVLFGESEHR